MKGTNMAIFGFSAKYHVYEQLTTRNFINFHPIFTKFVLQVTELNTEK